MSDNPVRRWIVPALFVGFVASATALAAAPQATSTNADQQVREVQEKLVQATLKGDKDTMARYLADDLVWTGSDGRVLDKQSRMNSTVPLKSVQVDKVIASGASAVVAGTAHFQSGPDARFIQQWVNQGGEWKVRLHHGTYVKPEATATTSAAADPSRPMGTSGAAASPRNVAPTLSSEDEKEVWKVQVALLDTYGKGDAEAYSRLTADDFVRVSTEGRLLTKSEWIDTLRPNAAKPTKPGAMSDVQIKVDNDTAVATLLLNSYKPDGNPNLPERQTRIFTKRNGAWQQLAAIATPISK